MNNELASVRLQATSIGDLLLAAADRHPDRLAVVLPYRRSTFAELTERAIQRALSLQSLGIKAGDHVGVLLPTSMDFVDTLFAVAMLGAVTVPINASRSGC